MLSFFNIAAALAVVSVIHTGGPSVDFLSVGQGDSSLISTSKGLTMLVDGGPGIEGLRSLDKATNRDRRIDVVVLTHPHSDHYVGLMDILKAYDVGTIVTSAARSSDPAFLEFMDVVKEKDIPVVDLASGDRMTLGDTEARILSPVPGEDISDPNSSSLVMMVEEEGSRFLFTGDIGKKEEKKMAEMYDIKADVLKVPHHGSGGSSSEVFLSEVRPSISVIEVGKNGYGLPKGETIDRLHDAGSIIYRTDEDGSIRIIPDSGTLRVMKIR